jgi:hypothetical protein
METIQTTRTRSNTNNIRVQNNTNIQLTQDEIRLLTKDYNTICTTRTNTGLKHWTLKQKQQ